MKIIHVIFCLFIGSVSSLTACAEQWEQEIADHPEPGVAEFYNEHAAEVKNLRWQVATSSDTEERLRALSRLAIEYPLMAELIARQNISNADEQLALMSVEILKNNLVMSDHPMTGAADDLSPRLKYMMKQHNKSKKALRLGVADSRESIRLETAGFLASLSDTQSLDTIAKGVDDGIYTELEAANLFTLASGGVAEKYLETYVGKGDIKAQQTAVSYLGANPEYQTEIRNNYFLNTNAPDSLRVQAAKTLSTYDMAFPEYGLQVLEEENVNPELYGAAVRGYINVSEKRDQLDPQTRQMLREKSQDYIGKQAEVPEDIRSEFESLDLYLESVEKDSVKK